MNTFRTLIQILFITALSLIGQWLSTTFTLPMPGNLIGMFLLLTLLFTGIVKEEHIDLGGDLLLKYMSFFFIPAGVGILAYLDIIGSLWLQWLSIIAISTTLVMMITAAAVEKSIKNREVRK